MFLDRYRIRFEKSFLSRVFALFLDTVGLPLSFFLPKNDVSTPKKILIIRKDEIGDNLLSTPMYEIIKKELPNSNITLLTTEYTKDLFKFNPNIDKVIVIEQFWKKRNPFSFIKGLLSVVKKIKAENFDTGIDPKGSILSILMLYLSKIRNTTSYYNVSGGKFMLAHPVFYSHQVHETESNLNLLRGIGIKSKKPFPLPKLYLTKEEKNEAKTILKGLKLKEFLCIYATPSKPYKRWPIEMFRELISSFPKRKFLICGLSKEKKLIESIVAGKSNCRALYDTDIRKTFHIFEKATAIVAVDGGLMHVAWAANRNTISLFGQVDLKLWKSLNESIVLCHCPESEQGLQRKPLDEWAENNKYMKMITVDEVNRALKEVLARKGGSKQ